MNKQMKNKFNAGDKVIVIYRDEKDTHWEVSNDTIESVTFTKDSLIYWIEEGGWEVPEKDLYTKEEAIEFLRGVL